jgi:NhaD family Na+/H+ antiporter
MIETLMSLLFIIGYAVISFEHPLKINKTGTAVLLGVVIWTVYILTTQTGTAAVTDELSHHLASISEILFFLMGAMTIVELIDTHQGFRIITSVIKTNSKVRLLWIISILTFFLSAVLDNLTTSIVMVSLIRKLVDDKKDRLMMASMIIIAANSGGAWSPIGDVTTTMLWIGNRVTAGNIISELFVPSLVSLLIPLIYQSFFLKGSFRKDGMRERQQLPVPFSNTIFFLGIGVLVSVPFFKTITHLPPYMGILFGLGLLWVITEILHAGNEERKHLRVTSVLAKIDLSSILFFLGILLAVAGLESIGLLNATASWLDTTVGNKDVIVTILGLLSAVIDNVPMVAATMGMYSLQDFPTDHKLWEMIAFCAGTGGSLLIIGSAAGVVVMGMEKIDFIWYLKKISFTALLGYLAGVGTYLLLYQLF